MQNQQTQALAHASTANDSEQFNADINRAIDVFERISWDDSANLVTLETITRLSKWMAESLFTVFEVLRIRASQSTSGSMQGQIKKLKAEKDDLKEENDRLKAQLAARN